ncbi:hypothetical protein ACQ4M3_41450 [Leptolyngbya sp. AN03gr2]|uniref:hypothetical protein n=1 Tax=unclassified Leptolyngbya TaxID=2650499 RepID=UPI003D3145EF
MQDQSIPLALDSTTGEHPNLPHSPKFDFGDRVMWFRVPTQDFGIVVDRSYGTEGSVQALGWHYTIQLDPHSPSFADCKSDIGFEDDLALLESICENTDAIE